MKKIIVSVKNSERRKNFDKLFNGLDYQYFDAIQPEANDHRFDLFIAKSIYGRQLRNGEVGCTLSHYSNIKKFAETTDDASWLLIMEDDALPEHGFINFVQCLPEINTLSPEIILLGHSKTHKNNLFTQRLMQPLYKKIKLCGQDFGENKNITLCGTVCYLINKKAAEIISCCTKPYWLADDWHLFINLGIAVKHPVRPLVYEDLSYGSSTGNDVRYLYDFFKHPISTLVGIMIGRYKYYRALMRFGR